VALYLTDSYRLLAPPVTPFDETDTLANRIRELLSQRGAMFS